MQVIGLLCMLISTCVGVMTYRVLNDIKNIKIYSKELYDREGWL